MNSERNAKRFGVTVIALTIAALLLETFGGYLIGAVDPYFGLKFHDNGDYEFHVRSCDLTGMNVGVDRLEYVESGGAHGGVRCTFYRGTKEIAGIREEGECYVGVVGGTATHPGHFIVLTDSRQSTGVWAIDPTTQVAPRRGFTAAMGAEGGLGRLQPGSADVARLDVARLLMDGLLIVPPLSALLALELMVATVVVLSDRKRHRASSN